MEHEEENTAEKNVPKPGPRYVTFPGDVADDPEALKKLIAKYGYATK